MKLNSLTKKDCEEILKDQKKFEQLVNNNKNFLNKIVSKYINKNSLNKNDSDLSFDLMQEATLSLWKKALPKYTGETKFSTFAYTVLKNDVLRYLQNKTKFDSAHGEIISLERFKSRDDGEKSGDYYESKWIYKRESENEIIRRMDMENSYKKLSKIDRVIYACMYTRMKNEETARMVGMNIATFMQYKKNVFKKRMMQNGIDIFKI